MELTNRQKEYAFKMHCLRIERLGCGQQGSKRLVKFAWLFIKENLESIKHGLNEVKSWEEFQEYESDLWTDFEKHLWDESLVYVTDFGDFDDYKGEDLWTFEDESTSLENFQDYRFYAYQEDCRNAFQTAFHFDPKISKVSDKFWNEYEKEAS